MIRFTSVHVTNTGTPVAINPVHTVAVFVEFEGETRISMVDGTVFIVSETFDEVTKALASTERGGAT